MRKIKSIIAVSAILSMMLFIFSGCSSYSYPGAKYYTAGDAIITDSVEKIYIDWTSGKVNFITHSSDTIEITEKIPDNTPDDMRVHWRLDGTTLYIKYSAPKPPEFFSFNFIPNNLSNPIKELTVAVPENLRFSDVYIGVTSASVNAPSITADKVSVSSTSGAISICCVCDEADISATSGPISAECDAEKINISTTSGSVSLTQRGVSEVVNITATSGKIGLNAENVNELSVRTTSGSIDLSALADHIELDSTSGWIVCKALSEPSECSIGATSGNVSLYLPTDADFTAEIDQTSGTFYSDFSVMMSGDKFISGDGSAKIKITTTSGKCEILAAE